MSFDHAAPSAQALRLVPGEASAPLIVFEEGVSFWGGVDPQTGRIIDAHHPHHGQEVAGKVLAMRTSRGSCSGSGVLLHLALSGRAPAALIFCEPEEVLTLGAIVADAVFDRSVPVIRLPPSLYARVTACPEVTLTETSLIAQGLDLPIAPVAPECVALSDKDRARRDGADGPATALAMQVMIRHAAATGARRLIDITRGHIDGCILAHDANLTFAETLADLGARVQVPTTINAISVDRAHWHVQGVPVDFGRRASRLADAYVQMGARPTFTCAPYLLPDPPARDEPIGWSESNAVIYANSVLGARTPKHPDYLDLFIAMTGRAPETGVYTAEGRRAERVLAFADVPPDADDMVWPLIGWLAGRHAPDCIPLVTGLEHLEARPDDLKALCAAFGTTSGAPMVHIAGHTPEAADAVVPDADCVRLSKADLRAAWRSLTPGPIEIDLVALGSPHLSAEEARRIVTLFGGRSCAPGTQMITTLGRATRARLQADGVIAALDAASVQLLPDLCWCSITAPILPPDAQGLMTNSGKFAHYAHGITGRPARLGSLAACVEAAVTGWADSAPPLWLR